MKKLKLLACLAAAVIAGFLFVDSLNSSVRAQKLPGADKPPAELVARLDAVIQRRFLDAPFFGMARIQPVRPPIESPHLSSFSPRSQEEAAVLKELSDAGWKVFINLYGRRATKTGAEKFRIEYRINDPVPVTSGDKNLPHAKGILGDVKTAFYAFQTAGSVGESGYDFDGDGWNYYARPVRASNQTCVECHKENYVVTQKVGEGRFNFRPRRVGDVNGVLVYGFAAK